MKRVLLIGPIPEPTTGVSLANKVVLQGLQSKDTFSVQAINTSYNKFDENLGKFSFSKFIFFLKINFHVLKVFKNDIIYMTPGQTFFGLVKYTLFILMSKLAGKELVIHIHGNYVGRGYAELKGLKKKIFRSLLKRTTKGIVLSESLKGNMSPFIDDHDIYVLYNFVEDYLFTQAETIQAKENNTTPRVIFLSNLMAEKGIFELLEALTILEEKGITYEAKIAGAIDAGNQSKVEEYFKKLKHAEYCGVVRGEDKKELLLWGNTFVLSTYYAMEGQPISILEAMATGNLVLTTQHAGIPDIFEDQVNGYFVEKKNAEDLADKIVLASKDARKSSKIRMHNFENALKKYRVDHFIKNIIHIFNA